MGSYTNRTGQSNGLECENLKSQIVISGWGGIRTPPCAFTEQGVARLSTVLLSDRGVWVNPEVLRAFVRLRQMLASDAELGRKPEGAGAKIRPAVEGVEGFRVGRWARSLRLLEPSPRIRDYRMPWPYLVSLSPPS